ncbi:hypothetical protein SSTG_05749 [Streptomyces sp. e14]|nr:hypothetical protein SSTG_05749 [Streptomyces sp. e14]
MKVNRGTGEAAGTPGGGATHPETAALARLLGTRPLTIKSHVNRVLHKLGAASRAHLVGTADESELVSPGSPTGGAPAQLCRPQ